MAEGGYALNSKSMIQDVKDTCSVCLEVIRDSRSLPCGHMFCALCLLGYIEKCLTTESSDSFPCPLCRAGIHVSNYKMSDEKDNISKFDLLSFSRISNENESRRKADDRCQPCKRGKENTEGTYFCSDCNECICTDCVTHHSRNKLTCNHTVTKIKTEGQTKPKDITCDFPTKCDLHGKKNFKYICIIHNMQCCSKCVIEGGHRHCSNVQSLTEFRKSNDYSTMLLKVNNLTRIVSKDVERLRQEQLKCLSYVTDKTSCLIKITNQLEEEILKEISKQIRNQTLPVMEKLKSFKEKSTKAVQTLEEIELRTHNSKISLNQVDEKFDTNNIVAVLCGVCKGIESEGKLVRELANTLDKTTPNITIEIEPIAKNFMEKLRRVRHRLSSDKCTLSGNIRYRIPILREQMAKTEKINDMIILQNGNVIIADETNSLTVLDSNLNSIVTISLTSQPTGVTEIDQKNVAVALPATKHLAIVTFDSNSHNVSEVDIDRSVTCLASGTVKGDRFILTYEPEARAICHQIVKFPLSKEFKPFSLNLPNVHQMCVDDKEQMVYVIQKRMNIITGLDFEGRRKFFFTDQKLHIPIGMYLHETNKLYLCCYGTQQISELTLPTREFNVLLCSSEGLAGPMAVTFDKTLAKCLVYDSDKGKELKLFDM